MKKYIFSVLMAAMAAFTFISCEDVPEPYTLPNQPETGGGSTSAEAKGTGTAADPFNIAGILKYIEDGGSADQEVYTKGKVVSVKAGSFDASYGSLKYYISDDGTTANQFYVYNGYAGPNRTKFSGEDALKPGDEVVICGKAKNYNGTNEYDANNYLVSLNGKPTSGSTTPETPTAGKGSLSDPYNVAEAIAAIKAGTAPTAKVYLTGIISDVASYSDQFKSITYYISDDGKSNDMQVFSGKGLNGADFTSKEDLKVGQKVTILGVIMKYVDKNNKEIMEVDKTSSIIKIEGEGTGGGEVKPDPDPTPDPNPGEETTAENGGFETWVEGKPTNWNTNSAGNATLTMSEDAHSGKYSVKVGGTTSGNKRLGYKEMSLKAGKYTLKFYAKATTDKGASVCPGHVAVIDGAVDSKNYKYGTYVNIKNTEWTLVEQEITIEKDGIYNIVIMNAKKPGGDVLIDDFTVTFGSTAIIK